MIRIRLVKIEAPKSNTHIRNPIAFEFDKKNAITTDGKKTNPPKFSGNSGGPIMELVTKINGCSESVGCKFAGIFVGWHKREKEAIAIRPEALISMIELQQSLKIVETERERSDDF